ncbi:hypothetical protein BDF20DRAFT_846341 [Mycotypha africana]|uniref:uncharacterized protein n=1 Tax=Mycotypha africana TaxID=64632 RepID=UPI002300542B|nr:uncharacterized protein BDF20DRAFT_846341 [Mycotypha africana]KAI8991781.1 hypothetical protein BDF20DRAFT_846341 [Mycotypha africana]
MLLITAADQYIGFAITSYLAQYERLRPHLRVLCEYKTRCLGFSKIGIDVRQVNYSHPNQLSMALRGVDTIILCNSNEEDRLQNAQHICNAAAHSGTMNIVYISHVGASSSDHSALQEYNKIEQEVIQTNCPYTILRLEFIQQYFHLWSSYAEKQRSLLLPLASDTTICPIDIEDVCKVVEELLIDNKQQTCKPLEDRHDGQVYVLTGPESFTAGQIVDILARATSYDHFKYRQGRPMDVSYYLKGLGKDIWFDARLKSERSKIYHDSFSNNNFKDKAYAAPTAKQIQTFLDYFDWAQKTVGSIKLPHTKFLIGATPQSIQTFFEENANSFKPRV